MTDIRHMIPEHIPHLRRRALQLSWNDADADDLVNDCIVKAIEKSHLWRPGSNLRAWLSVILRNLFISRYRQQAVRPTLVEFDEATSTLRSEPRQEKAMEVSALQTAMNHLPRDQRGVVSLICLQGLSYQEAADEAGVPIGTIRSRLSRARQALEAEMESGSDNDAALRALASAAAKSGAPSAPPPAQ